MHKKPLIKSSFNKNYIFFFPKSPLFKTIFTDKSFRKKNKLLQA